MFTVSDQVGIWLAMFPSFEKRGFKKQFWQLKQSLKDLATRADNPGQPTGGQRTSHRSPTGGHSGGHGTFCGGQGWTTGGDRL